MKRYNVIINKNEYQIPMIVSETNKDLFEKNSFEYQGNNYFDINKLVKENNLENIRKICDQNIYGIGMMLMDDENQENMKRYQELSEQFRMLDNTSYLEFQKGNYELGYQKILTEIELALQFYEEILKQDDKVRKGR